MTEPASIRYKNPGAMWGGNAISRKWGERGNVKLNDGMGQNNHIAVFPTYVQGICAQIDLWRSPRYHNKRFADAIKVWSGGNWVQSYIDFVKKRVPGMDEDTIMSDAMLSSPMGIKFLKAQAWHEAGKPYPAPEADWIEAQKRVFYGTEHQKPLITPKPEPDDTAPHAAPAGSSKTGITEGAQAAGGLTLAGIISQVWDSITQAPDSILQAIINLAQKPAFVVAVLVLCAVGYIWWRRHRMKKAG